MKQQTVGTKLFASAGALILLAIGIGIYAAAVINSLNAKVTRVSDVNAKKQRLASDLHARLTEVLAAERGIVLNASDKSAADAYNEESSKALEAIRSDFSEFPLATETEEGLRLVNDAQKKLELISATTQQIWQSVRDGKGDQALMLYKSEFIANIPTARAATRALQQHEVDLLRGISRAASESADWSRWLTSFAILFVICIGGVVVWIVRGVNFSLRKFVSDLNNTSEQVASASGQIAATSQTLSQGSSEQAASLEEISASMEEMTAMSKRNSENSSEVAAMMTQSAAQVERSNVALHEMVESMSAIKTSSEKVAKIIKTIDEIAFQTNILALNAAVEAARAGEAGMGFAVVADEVRNLAQRSAVAAKDTAELIEEAIKNSHQGAERLERVEAEIQAITESADKVKQLAEEVNESSRQQTQGIQQASEAVTQVSKVTQTAAASAEESAAASEELSAQAQGMRHLVQTLRGMVGGTSHLKEKPIARRVDQPRRPAPAKPKSSPAHVTGSKTSIINTHEDPFPMDAIEVGDFRSF